MKKIIGFILVLMFGSSVFAQQITKFGVVDTAKVYNAYFRNSAPDELQKLQSKKVEYEKNGNDALVLKTDAEITKKKDFLIEYTNAKNAELESMQKTLQGSDAFYNKLYDTLSKVAEAGGYSMILSLQQSNSILWYSNSVDVTEQVIAELGK